MLHTIAPLSFAICSIISINLKLHPTPPTSKIESEFNRLIALSVTSINIAKRVSCKEKQKS
uniref:Uncharacterized protein n=1 Tax=Cryptosporidium parvum TaxID=5807 RepID=F0X541_CRYPV